MAKEVLFVVATDAEAGVLKAIPGIRAISGGYVLKDLQISVLVTGVGSVATAWSLTRNLTSGYHPELAINAGIAGSYNTEFGIGEVVVPVTDCFADLGIETGNGFLTLDEAGLENPDRFPFKNGVIKVSDNYINSALKICRPVRAITVNTASGTLSTIERLKKKYDPDIETMEGATFFYICAGEKVPFLAFRSVSNMVEPRDRSKWNIKLALDRLSERLNDFFLNI